MLEGFSQQPQRDRIIVALDCGRDQAIELARNLRGHASWLKVGMTLYYAEGPAIVSELKDMGFNIFVDLKFHDIPHQVRGAAASVVRSGADMLTMHACGGLAMMEAGVQGCREAASGQDPITLGITVLTSMDQASLDQVGVAKPVADQVESLARLAQKSGLTGVVASPMEARMLRQVLGERAAIVTPGVRPAGADAQDQSRIATPQAAFSDGASHLVIGRPITQASDPCSAFEDIAAQLEG